MHPLPYDALLVVSFGGPEGPEDVIPFLENVLRGRNVPRERMLEVAEHYQHFGGRSPINEQNLALIDALREEFLAAGWQLPIYFGNRNWHPLLTDAIAQMARDGVRRALAYFTSQFSCYSGCRQYRENIEAARAAVGPNAPIIEKLRFAFNHPGYIEPLGAGLRSALEQIPLSERESTPVLFTAHSIPLEMAATARYEAQLQEASRLVAEQAGHSRWELVYQSRSGPPQQPWLEPDVGDRTRMLHREQGIQHLVVLPIGFVSDHMEVLYDLDTELAQICDELGIHLVRAPTVGVHPHYVRMIRELIEERCTPGANRLALGSLGPSHDVCPERCCWYEPRRPARTAPPSDGTA
jgi:ferrochelatase